MDDGLKKRLIGAAVLSSLAVIFVPMLFEQPPAQPPPLAPLPERPPTPDFASRMLSETVPEIKPLAPRESPVEPAQAAVAPQAPATAGTPPVRQRAGLTAWVVQVGSFSSRDNAAKLVRRLREAGLPTPDPDLVDIRGKRYYRVRVGPVVERAEADRLLGEVNTVAGTKAAVRRYP